MDAKRALEEASGDAEKAIEILRVKGAAKAEKRAERGAAEGCHRRDDAVREVADVEVLAVHRRAGLSHLRVEHHADGLGSVVHRDDGAEVADHRRNDVAALAAAEPDRGGVDRFLSEGAEALSLE